MCSLFITAVNLSIKLGRPVDFLDDMNDTLSAVVGTDRAFLTVNVARVADIEAASGSGGTEENSLL